ncbi:unnamed protein product [Acanthosepion pharaonis]|uniref:Uncharacterized protein n=1 Tax=Acanthosepion pharaonis TaxID=158019 RepID=A0A812DDL0_ACAPH|nr:unnamed protein product [Sepia pharaonis]
MSGGTDSVGLMSVSSYSANLALCSSSPEMVLPFWSLTKQLGLLFFPESLFDFIQPFHVSLPRCSLCFLGQVFNEDSLVFFTFRFFSQSRVCNSRFSSRSWVWLIWSFSSFLSVINAHVSLVNHSFYFLFSSPGLFGMLSYSSRSSIERRTFHGVLHVL